MDSTATDRDALEEKLRDPNALPIPLPFEFLNDITCNFSEEIGRGGYGVVYKGVLRSGKIIAVKMLFGNLVDDDQFQKEITNLIGIKHQNIVQLVGYCVETRSEAIKLPSGIYVMAQIPKSLLCLEYLCNKSLDKHVSDESCGLGWKKRYEIIKGICNGLHFLHGECRIVHLDLKPENILMDGEMMPKIADFGLSKLLGAQKSRTIVSGNLAGSLGYMAPEYLWHGVVSPKADIFSFGVIIIQIITGVKEYPMTVLCSQELDENSSHQSTEIRLMKYKDNVIGRWRNVFKKEQKHTSMEVYIQQVEQCITTALECLSYDSTRRPTSCDISQFFTGEICNCQKKTLLSAQPSVLRFHFTDYHVVTSCPLQLINNTDHIVAYRIMARDREKYFPWPVNGFMLPRSMSTVRVALRRPVHDDNNFSIKIESAVTDKHNQLPDDQASGSDDNNHIFGEAKKKGREVQQVKLLFVIAREPRNEIISRYPGSFLYGMFVHPTKTWIITVGSMGNMIDILDYQKQQRVDSSEFLALDRIFKAMLFPKKQWFVVGCFSGHIKVYNYETTEEVKTFRAHHEYVTSLDIHPSKPCVLSASYSDGTVKVWNWEKDWECVWAIELDDVRLAKFNPNDADCIFCATPENVKVLNISYPGSYDLSFCISPWSGFRTSEVWSLELITRGDELYVIMGQSDGTVKIWNWRIDRTWFYSPICLQAHAGAVSTVCAHPDLPTLITGSYDGTICLWNSFTFKLESKLDYHLRDVYTVACLKGSNRIAIGHRDGITITEI